MRRTLKTRLFLSYLFIVLAFAISTGILGYTIMKIDIMMRAQIQVGRNLAAARSVFEAQIRELRSAFDLIDYVENTARLKSRMDLDYLFVVPASDSATVRSEIVRCAFRGNATGGVRALDSTEICAMDNALCRRARIELISTPKAKPVKQTVLTSAMAIECATPFFDRQGGVARVVYGGRILNRHFGLVDRIHDIVYENRLYNSKPVGTVTLFLDDVRVTTNVLDKNGERAIGTRVSQAVYENVIEKGKPWFDRAFVVTDWYLTAYEPIRDINGKILGILYVGALEQPYKDRIQSRVGLFLLIVGVVTALALISSLVLSSGISRPLTEMVLATEKISTGDLDHRIEPRTSVSEIEQLAEAFNEMAGRLHERENSLRDMNQKLSTLNKSYLDLIGMVSHELKGILASATLNTYSVRDGHLGDINAVQKKALSSIARNLEYFDSTIKNFLNLSRIEKDEFEISRTHVLLQKDVIFPSLEVFMPQAKSRSLEMVHAPEPEIELQADSAMLFMVSNNLIGNAVKYGKEGGRIEIRISVQERNAIVEVYNDGRQISPLEMPRLFQRFSRLDAPESRNVRGTGLGLFISRQIIEKHGGKLWCEPRETGNSFLFTLPMGINPQQRS